MISNNYYNVFLEFLKKDKKSYKNTKIFLSVEFFEAVLHNFLGSFLNLIKIKLKRSKSTNKELLKQLLMTEELHDFYVEIIIPLSSLYCFLKNIDFSNETIDTFFKNTKKRNYINQIIWFINNPYKVFAVTIKNIFYKNLYV